MTLHSQRSSQTGVSELLQRQPRAGRPVVYVLSLAKKSHLEEFPVFTNVVQ